MEAGNQKALGKLKLAPSREAEIIELFEQHLDDRYQELVDGGASEEQAVRAALDELSDSDQSPPKATNRQVQLS